MGESTFRDWARWEATDKPSCAALRCSALLLPGLSTCTGRVKAGGELVALRSRVNGPYFSAVVEPNVPTSLVLIRYRTHRTNGRFPVMQALPFTV
jgi:hypothetical protein